MKRDKKRKTLQETLSSLDGVLAALDAYPNLEDALLEKAQGEANKYLGQFFPTQLDFGKEILEHLVGMDALIEIVSKFLTVALPGVEVSLKTALLANMQNLGTNCTIDPIIYEKAIKEGVIFDLKQIDLYDKLTISPLDRKIGKYYYFGIEGCESAYDILQSAIDPNNQTENQNKKWSEKNENGENSPTQKEDTSYLNRTFTDSVGHYFGQRKRDFDCLLWYMKNKAAYREVWGKRTSESEDIFNGDKNIQGWINKKGDKKTCYYQISGNSINFLVKGDSSVQVPSGGSLVPVTEGTNYTFLDGKSYYTYSFGQPPIKKLKRSKYYFQRESDDKLWVYYWDKDSNVWSRKPVSNKNYEYMEKLPLIQKPDGSYESEKKKDDFVLVDNVPYILTSEPELKTKEDKNGIKATYVSNVKSAECIDITNDLNENLSLFIDYELDDNAQKIKDGLDVQSSFNGCTPNNTGKKQWHKKKDNKKTAEENVSPSNCYYIKYSEGDFDPSVDKIIMPPHIIKDGSGKPCVNINDAIAKKNKYTKDFGVVTLEYSPRTGNVLQSDGKPLQQQTPYDNVLHVFFGNVKELHTQERDNLQNQWKESSETNKLGVMVYDKMVAVQERHIKIWKRKLKEWKKLGDPNGDVNAKKDAFKRCREFEIATNDYNAITFGNNIDIKTNLDANNPLFDDPQGLNTKLQNINTIIETYYKSEQKEKEEEEKDTKKNKVFVKDDSNNDEFDFSNFKSFETEILKELGGYSIWAYSQRAAQLMDANENLMYLSAKNLEYPEANKNYYLKRTLFEFNADYVNSLQLFDSKVLAAQLITSLFGSLTMEAVIGATASWKTELIRDVVRDIVEKTIAAEDVAVSDCFFTFTNDSYNGMLRAAELRQAGLYSKHGEENGNNKINPIKLLEGLNGIDESADQAGQTTIIKGAIMQASGEVCKDIYKENNYLAVNTNFGIQKSFIETLMINLCTQLVMAMLSPKVYLLILINLEMFGLSTNFDLKAFLERFENLIRSIVKSVVDQFMQFLVQEIMRIVEELIQKLISKLMFEQVEMYTRLLKQIWMHLKLLTRCGNTIGWTQDVVGSADIISSDSQEPINEC